MVTNQMVEAGQRWAQQRAGYLSLTDEFVRGLIKAALREQQAEPVAVVRAVTSAGENGVRVKWIRGFPQIGDRLYTHPPQPDAACCTRATCRVGQRVPLTDEEIVDAVQQADLDWQVGWTLDEHEPNRFTTLVRAIERAHGIGGKK